MTGRFIVASLIVLAVAAPAAVVASSEGKTSDTDAYVYVAEEPGRCEITHSYDGQVLSVYVHSGDYNDITGVLFRIDCPRFGPEHVVSVTAPPEMTIIGGNIFDGIIVFFSGRHLDHDPVLLVELAGHGEYGDAWTRDVAIVRGGTTVPAPDFATFGGSVDCFDTNVWWMPPDTVDVLVDEDETFSFKAMVLQGGYPPNGMVSAVDANGWIPDPVAEWVWAGCVYCPWNFTVVTVPVHAPKGTADGALNPVTFQMLSFGRVEAETTIVLRAVNPIATEKTTWGRVKALYQ